MSIARVSSRAQLGLDAPRVDVEVHLGGGLPTFSIVGMSAGAAKESKERVRAALANSGFEYPAGRITVNLSPAELPKQGGRYDLPIALGILLASGQGGLSPKKLADTEFYGELGLTGELKPVRGILVVAAQAAREGRAIVIPSANVREARLAARVVVRGVTSLLEAVAGGDAAGVADVANASVVPSVPDLADVRGQAAAKRALIVAGSDAAGVADFANASVVPPVPDLADVRGQAAAKRALIVAAAGGHSLLLVGPPGTGKTMLAQRLPGLLPALNGEEALDVAAVASVSSRGFELGEYGFRPFRAPHHTASASAIIGGGPHARPGEVSLAHRGVLFLDELPEFNRGVLESLREPLESGVVAISRAAMRIQYPARFQLVAAMNPCPCGYLGDVSGRCRCPPPLVERYRARISGPLLDRIDLRVAVSAPSNDELLIGSPPSAAQSPDAALRVGNARIRQWERAGKLNADLAGAETQRHCAPDRPGRRLIAQARTKMTLSARGVHRVMRVARTIADLEGSDSISPAHLAEALQLRRAID